LAGQKTAALGLWVSASVHLIVAAVMPRSNGISESDRSAVIIEMSKVGWEV
jgi:hypothetical protein